MKKNFCKIALLVSLALANSNLAFADSGASAMPPKPSEMHQMFYKMYAPRTQTTYKQLTVVTRKVDDIRKDGDKLQAWGGNIMAGGTAAGIFLPKNPLVLKGVSIVSGAGGIMHLIGSFGKTSMEKFKSGSVIKSVVYFKWTNPDKLEHSVKIESWVEYKGVKVSNVSTHEYHKTL